MGTTVSRISLREALTESGDRRPFHFKLAMGSTRHRKPMIKRNRLWREDETATLDNQINSLSQLRDARVARKSTEIMILRGYESSRSICCSHEFGAVGSVPHQDLFCKGCQLAHKSQMDGAYDYICKKFARGQLEPGQKLSRRVLAEEIGCSPALVQHALGQLEKAGLVECRPQSGTYVRNLTVDEFIDLHEMRELIEPHSAARAAERITSQQIKILETSCRRYHSLQAKAAACESPLELWKIHSEIVEEEQVFHGTILAASANSMLTSLVQSLRLLSQITHKSAATALRLMPNVALEHDGITEALKAHDPKLAGKRMLEHLRVGRDMAERRMADDAKTTKRNAEVAN
jgi:DNA-binding GntR family transcriptional regulator